MQGKVSEEIRAEIKSKLESVFYGGSEVSGFRLKKVNMEENILAPEPFCYKISYKFGNKKGSGTYWPNSVGFQLDK